MAARASVSEADKRWLRALRTLNESQVRLFVAERALGLGRGGISRLARLTGMSRSTIVKGAAELQGRRPPPPLTAGRIRQGGGGRRRVEEADPKLLRHLERILDETTAGDPMSVLKWTSKSTRAIAAELTRRGHPVTGVTVARLLHALDYSLQGNVKAIEGRQHPDRDAQFRYINAQVKGFLRTGDPVCGGPQSLVGKQRGGVPLRDYGLNCVSPAITFSLGFGSPSSLRGGYGDECGARTGFPSRCSAQFVGPLLYPAPATPMYVYQPPSQQVIVGQAPAQEIVVVPGTPVYYYGHGGPPPWAGRWKKH